MPTTSLIANVSAPSSFFCIPAALCSALVVESYKKAILVQLLHDGTKLKLPKYTPNIVLRLLPVNSNHYTGEKCL